MAGHAERSLLRNFGKCGEEIDADECQDNGARYLTFVRYRLPFGTTVYTEIVRRLDRHAIAKVDEITG
jgi:hypothetical protein